MPVTLGARDVDAVLGLISEAAAADGDHPFELPLIDRLAGLVPADQAGYFEYRIASANAYSPATTVNVHIVKQRRGEDISWNHDEITEVLPSWPLHDSRGSRTSHATRFSDALTTRATKLRNPWYATVMRRCDVEHEMKLWLPAPAKTVRGFFFVREPGRDDFAERDRAVLTVLRVHLATVRERWERRRHPPGLTDRELDVLHALRDGLTNREIADRLVISPGTVRTHLENIFDKLGAHTRTAALARAFGGEPPTGRGRVAREARGT